MKPVIDIEKCFGCGACVDSCPYGVLELKHGKATVTDPHKCDGRWGCIRACTVKAIKKGWRT